MAEGIFLTAAVQTAELQALNIPSPQDIEMNTISPIFDAVAVANAVTASDDYYFDIKNLHSNHRSSNNVHYQDLREAKRFKTGCEIAATIPALAKAFADQNVHLAPIMAILIEIQQNQATSQQSITLIQQNQATMQQSITLIQQNQATMQQSITLIQQNQATMQQALTSIEDNAAENHLATQQAIAVLNTKATNASALDDDDVVEPPQNGMIAPNPEFPTTILEIRNLQPGLLLTEIENYYGLHHGGSRITRIRRVKRAYGVTI